MRAVFAVVIGAGPAGLSAAAVLARHGEVLLVEEGADARARDRDAPRDLLSGVGGAGLFSDGKHSFFPAATALWQLPDRDALGAAFAETAALLADFSVDAGALPSVPTPTAIEAGTWHTKAYPSIYVSLADRFALIARLAAAGATLATGTRVVELRRRDGRIEVAFARGETVSAAHVVVAGGRWAPHGLRALLTAVGVRFQFGRAEIGVRIETAATAPLFAALPGVDGKLRFSDEHGRIELRTFCTCRNGEVVLGEAAGLRAFSGRADVAPTGRSNVGLVVRTPDRALGRVLFDGVVDSAPLQIALADWQHEGAPLLSGSLGRAGARLLSDARDRLLAFCPSLADEPAEIYAPVIEGIGDYPVDDGSLQLGEGLWIAGDAGGRFRGIVAAMVSGRYVAHRIARAQPR